MITPPKTNGPVEGINNKLRVIARRAYGFHSHGGLISMLFLCRGGIELGATPTHTRLTARGRSLFAEPRCSGSLAMSN